MGSRHVRPFLCALLAGLATMLPARAFAQLGADVNSVARDVAKVKAPVIVKQTTRYTVREMMSASGSTVRQFATPEGQIFAVAWEGPFHPDYQQLLGTYFDRLQQAMQQPAGERRARRAPVLIETPEFVFQSFGHVRALAGRAFVPQMLPAGVGMEEIR
ncbi:MAG: DUF2844 domain-containing protein [Bacteroidales bacterium]